MIWAMSPSDEFGSLVHERELAALVVIDEYALVLESASLKFCFLESWSGHLLARIAGLLGQRLHKPVSSSRIMPGAGFET